MKIKPWFSDGIRSNKKTDSALFHFRTLPALMFLISFQKFRHRDNFRHIHIQNQKILIPRHEYVNVLHDRRCQYRRILCITHFREFIQIQRFRCVDQFKRKFQKETIKEFNTPLLPFGFPSCNPAFLPRLQSPPFLLLRQTLLLPA